MIDGWFLIYKENGIEVSKKIIWNAKSQQFINLKLEDRTKGDKFSITYGLNTFIRPSKAHHYDQFPVYGYYDYAKDVIKLLENVENLPAPLIDALGRSYTAMAVTVISTKRYDIKNDTGLKYDKTFNPKDFTLEQVNDYVGFMKKSITTFKHLMETYPNYRTIVGNIRMKYWNEHMNAYLNLQMLGQAEAAKQFLVDDLYDDFQLKTAINTLNSCAENGILFNYGDSYCLYYVQDKLNIRPDVALLNVSLLELGRFIHYIKKRHNVEMTYDLEQYKQGKNIYFTINKNKEITNFYDFLVTSNLKPDSAKNGEKYIEIPTSMLQIPFNVGNVRKQIKADSIDIRQKMMLFMVRSYLTQGYFSILDIITTNNFKRPIYFTVGSSKIIYELDLTNKAYLDGLTYRLLPIYNYDYDILVDKILSKFQYSNSKKVNWSNLENSLELWNYLYAFHTVLRTSIDKQSKKVKRVTRKMERKFPLKYCNYKGFNMTFANYYYEQNDFKKGDKYIKKGLEEIEQFFKSLDDATIDWKTESEVEFYLWLLEQLKLQTNQFDRKSFGDLESLYQSYLKQAEYLNFDLLLDSADF